MLDRAAINGWALPSTQAEVESDPGHECAIDCPHVFAGWITVGSGPVPDWCRRTMFYRGQSMAWNTVNIAKRADGVLVGSLSCWEDPHA